MAKMVRILDLTRITEENAASSLAPIIATSDAAYPGSLSIDDGVITVDYLQWALHYGAPNIPFQCNVGDYIDTAGVVYPRGDIESNCVPLSDLQNPS